MALGITLGNGSNIFSLQVDKDKLIPQESTDCDKDLALNTKSGKNGLSFMQLWFGFNTNLRVTGTGFKIWVNTSSGSMID